MLMSPFETFAEFAGEALMAAVEVATKQITADLQYAQSVGQGEGEQYETEPEQCAESHEACAESPEACAESPEACTVPPEFCCQNGGEHPFKAILNDLFSQIERACGVEAAARQQASQQRSRPEGLNPATPKFLNDLVKDLGLEELGADVVQVAPNAIAIAIDAGSPRDCDKIKERIKERINAAIRKRSFNPAG